MENNLKLPYEDDVRAMLSLTMGRCSLLERRTALFSATPHFAVTLQVGANRHQTVRVGFADEADAGDWQQESEKELGWLPEAIEWQPLGGPTVAVRAEQAQARTGGGKAGSKGDAGRREGKGGRGACACTTNGSDSASLRPGGFPAAAKYGGS